MSVHGDSIYRDALREIPWTDFSGRKPGTGVHVVKNTDQDIAADTNTLIDWDAEEYDDEGEFDLTADEFTAGRAGRYHVFIAAGWQGVTAGDALQLRSYINGDLHKLMEITANGATPSIFLPFLADLASGDVLDFYAFSDAANTVNGSTDQTYVFVTYLGP